MLSKTRYGASLARKPMVYSRTENGSARVGKSIEEVENVGNNEENIDESNEQTEEKNDENEAASEAPPVEKSRHRPHPPSQKTPRRKGLDNTDTENRPKVYLRPAKRGHPQLYNRSLFTEDPLLMNNGSLLAQFHHPLYEEEIERAIAERNDALTRVRIVFTDLFSPKTFCKMREMNHIEGGSVSSKSIQFQWKVIRTLSNI